MKSTRERSWKQPKSWGFRHLPRKLRESGDHHPFRQSSNPVDRQSGWSRSGSAEGRDFPEALRTGPPANVGRPPTLDKRHRNDGFRLVIATSASADDLERLMERAGIVGLDEFTSASDVDASKPEPDLVVLYLRWRLENLHTPSCSYTRPATLLRQGDPESMSLHFGVVDGTMPAWRARSPSTTIRPTCSRLMIRPLSQPDRGDHFHKSGRRRIIPYLRAAAARDPASRAGSARLQGWPRE